MAFDIYQLDHLESDDFEKTLSEYQDALGELFFHSPEGQAYLQVDPDMGFWSAQLDGQVLYDGGKECRIRYDFGKGNAGIQRVLQCQPPTLRWPLRQSLAPATLGRLGTRVPA